MTNNRTVKDERRFANGSEHWATLLAERPGVVLRHSELANFDFFDLIAESECFWQIVSPQIVVDKLCVGKSWLFCFWQIALWQIAMHPKNRIKSLKQFKFKFQLPRTYRRPISHSPSKFSGNRNLRNSIRPHFNSSNLALHGKTKAD